MPGDDRRKIEKALGLGVDAIIMDLEDGVALNRKDTARLRIASALNELSFGRQACLVRINSVSTPLWQADLESALSPKLDAIVLPKVEHSAHIKLVSERIAQFEQQHGLPLHKISLLAIIETAMGVLPYSVALMQPYHPGNAWNSQVWVDMMIGLAARATGNVASIDIQQAWPNLIPDGSTNSSLMYESTSAVHPNAAGHARYAELMTDALRLPESRDTYSGPTYLPGNTKVRLP